MGEAGGGAERQARRAGERVERLRRDLTAAELRERLAAAERSHHAWTSGAEGERLVAQTLGELETHGWHLLHDVHWPGRRSANLDHVAVGPGGVVVVDAKKWSGTVRISDGHLRQNGYRRDRELEGVARATAAVAALLPPEHRASTRGLLCLVDQPVRPTRTRSGVPVVGRTHLVHHLRSLNATLTSDDVDQLTHLLRAQLDGPRSPALTTTAAVDPATPSPQAPPARARRPVSRRTARHVRRRALAAFVVVLVLLFLTSMLVTRLVGGLFAPFAPTG
ncbi:NERD domain-containing protein [Kineococcus endophyticus]